MTSPFAYSWGMLQLHLTSIYKQHSHVSCPLFDRSWPTTQGLKRISWSVQLAFTKFLEVDVWAKEVASIWNLQCLDIYLDRSSWRADEFATEKKKKKKQISSFFFRFIYLHIILVTLVVTWMKWFYFHSRLEVNTRQAKVQGARCRDAENKQHCTRRDQFLTCISWWSILSWISLSLTKKKKKIENK